MNNLQQRQQDDKDAILRRKFRQVIQVMCDKKIITRVLSLTSGMISGDGDSYLLASLSVNQMKDIETPNLPNPQHIPHNIVETLTNMIHEVNTCQVFLEQQYQTRCDQQLERNVNVEKIYDANENENENQPSPAMLKYMMDSLKDYWRRQDQRQTIYDQHHQTDGIHDGHGHGCHYKDQTNSSPDDDHHV